MRQAGAATIFFDLHLNNRVGTPSAPADPSTIALKAQKEFAFAQEVTGCATPLIAENELFGAQTPTPWSATNAQYRANVLALLRELDALGATTAITIANPPYTGGDAADWWRDAADAAILIRQVYFTVARVEGALHDGSRGGEPLDAARHARARLTLRADRDPGLARRARAAVPVRARPGRAQRAAAEGSVARDRQARGAGGEAGRRRDACPGDLVVGLAVVLGRRSGSRQAGRGLRLPVDPRPLVLRRACPRGARLRHLADRGPDRPSRRGPLHVWAARRFGRST